jgi:TolB-like protein/Flp pilus assembly protein TadD
LRYLFENYALDTNRRELLRGADLVTITPQVFDLLDYLIRNRERVVSKNDLIDAIWNGRIVSDTAVTTRLNAARTAIGDTGEEQRLVKTLPRKGFRFVGSVLEAERLQVAPPDNPEESSKPALTLPDKPSIAVLPFANLSSDPEQEYFADGIVEDITTALSRTGWLFVIARNSSFTYKGRAVDIKQVGRELGVRYVLEGSIRRSGGRVRITGQLIEATTGGHVWADRFEGAFDDIFELQDRITNSVVGAIEPSVRRAETARAWSKPTDNLDAYDLYLRGVHQIYVATHESLDAAIGFLRNAVASDPDYELAKAYLALAYAIRDALGWAAPGAREAAIALARGAISAADDNPTTLRAAGYALAYFADQTVGVSGGDFGTASAALNRALRLHPNSAHALHSLGFVHMWSGDTEQAIDCFVRAIRVSPRDQEMGYMLHGLGTTYLMCDRKAEALEAGLRAVEEMPKNGSSHRLVIVALVRLGRLEEAREATVRLLKIVPESHLANIKPPSQTPGFAEGYLSDLRLAGYPE